MWTVTLTKGVNQSNQNTFTLTYTNGDKVFAETFLWESISAANAMAYGRIQQLTAYDSAVEGVFTPTAN